MKLHHAHAHLSRRDALKMGAAASAAVAIGGTAAGAEEGEEAPSGELSGELHAGHYDDTMFDLAAAVAGGYWVSPYGPDDERGTLNEVTPWRTANALRRMRRYKGINSYQMGESMFNGFPAFPSDPPRLHDMFMYVLGFDAGQEFVDGGGIQSATEPLGPNLLVGHEERFAENFTFQIGSQVDGLAHVGIGTEDGTDGRFYNDIYASDILTPTGTTKLGNETMGPIVTRGVIIDVAGLKQANGDTDDYFLVGDQPVLRDNYRITIDDIEKALRRQKVWKRIGPGDIPILHTGWTHLIGVDDNRYLAQEPGIYLAEARYFTDRKVAMVATDTWGLEVLDPEVTGGNVFPAHQELLGHTGIRIGESWVTDAAIADHAYDGVAVVTPENAPGATAGSSAPAFLGQKGPKPRY